MKIRDEEYDRHHRKPKARGGKGSAATKVVRRKEHVAWHILFPGHLNPHQIAKIINSTWIDPEYQFVVRRKR